MLVSLASRQAGREGKGAIVCIALRVPNELDDRSLPNAATESCTICRHTLRETLEFIFTQCTLPRIELERNSSVVKCIMNGKQGGGL